MLKIYKASAGSGKTYTLALEFIRELLRVWDPQKSQFVLNIPKYTSHSVETSNRHRYLLAITFTNKATEEMKRRIIDELAALSTYPKSGDEDANYAETLCKELKCNREELALAASKALHQLLYDYSDFNVTTIDSFFQRVLRTFARELDQQGDFNVELRDNDAVNIAVNSMIDEFNAYHQENTPLGHWIYEFVLNRIQQGKKTNLFNRNSTLHQSLVTQIARITVESFKPYVDEMRNYLKEPQKIKQLKRQLKEAQKKLLEDIKAYTQYKLKELEANQTSITGISTSSVAYKIINDSFIKGELAKKTHLDNEKIKSIIFDDADPFLKKEQHTQTDIDIVKSILEYGLRLSHNILIIDEIYHRLDLLQLLQQAWGYLDELISENNIVLLSDTNHILSKIIGEAETPFIYEKMGVQFHHFLIDEFQDTSKLQWKNLSPLVKNGIDEFNSLIIGDEKQSIYRFRNSDSSLLHSEVHQEFSPRYKIDIIGNNPGENTNYRSAADIVRFNNTLFTLLAKTKEVEGFENVIQEISDKRLSQPAYIHFIPTKEKTDKSSKKTKTQKASEPTEIDELKILAENIRRQHDEGGYDWHDIAVLTRTRKQAANVIQYFTQLSDPIPAMSEEALYVNKSPAVQLIVGILKIFAQPTLKKTNQNSESNNEDEKANKLTFPTAEEVKITISRFKYFQSQGLSTHEALDAALNDALSTDDAGLNSHIQAIRKRQPSTLTSLVESIIYELVPESECASQSAYINAFQDYVLNFCQHNVPSIIGLLNDWETTKKKLSVSSATGTNAVAVMTIHKSKGLEFDCVHIPYGSWALIGDPNGKWYPKPDIEGIDSDLLPPTIYLELEAKTFDFPGTYFYDQFLEERTASLVDTMNLTYVAYTRAGSELTVYYDPNKGIGTLLDSTFAIAPTTNSPLLYSLHEAYKPTGELEIGHPTTKKKNNAKADKSDSTIYIDTYNVYCHNGADVLTRVNDMLDLDDNLEDNDQTIYEVDQMARVRGIALHQILSNITTVEDIDEAIEHQRRQLRLSDEAIVPVRDFLMETLHSDNELIHKWFADNQRVYNEQPIYIPDLPERFPDIKIKDNDDYVRRPDRIVEYADGSADVIDYKFTNQSDNNTKHKRQVREYMQILKSLGYSTVRGYLWYPLYSNEIIKVELPQS